MRNYTYRICVIVFMLSVIICSPAFAVDVSGPVRVGVAFTSDTFEIPSELSDFVVDIVGNVMASVSSISIVKQQELNQAGTSLGISQSSFSDVQEISAIGQAADVPLILVTKINYDFKAAAAQEAKNAAMKKLPFGGGKAKHVQPTFDVSLIDVASQKLVYNNTANLDLFTADMQEKLLNSLASGEAPLGIGSINPKAITSLVGGLVPNISKAVSGTTKLAATATKEGVQGVTETAEGYVETAEAVVELIAPKSRVVNAPTFENKSTDPAKVIAGYGYSTSDVKELVKKHKAAMKIKNNEKKLEAYSNIFDEYGEDYLAAYQAALAAFNMNDGATSLEWCDKALSINKQYTPARRLRVKARKL